MVRIKDVEQFNPPTSIGQGMLSHCLLLPHEAFRLVLQPGETQTYAVRFLLCPGGPNTRAPLHLPCTFELPPDGAVVGDATINAAGRPVVNAVPGYVISTTMAFASLYVRLPVNSGLSVLRVQSDNESILLANTSGIHVQAGVLRFGIHGLARGRVAVNISYSDGTVQRVHMYVLSDLKTLIER